MCCFRLCALYRIVYKLHEKWFDIVFYSSFTQAMSDQIVIIFYAKRSFLQIYIGHLGKFVVSSRYRLKRNFCCCFKLIGPQILHQFCTKSFRSIPCNLELDKKIHLKNFIQVFIAGLTI